MVSKPILTEDDWKAAAARLRVSVAKIKAVAEIEAPRGPFLPSGEPPVLFERHKFSRHTRGKYDATHPDISNPKQGGYGPSSKQHERLARAAALDRNAALKSASFGQFQILGENHAAAGHKTLQGFVNAMYRSARDQLDAFVAFLESEGLDVHLRAGNWVAFAEGYNGPAQAKHDYSGRMAAAFRRLGGK
jgi:hypothetical protein